MHYWLSRAALVALLACSFSGNAAAQDVARGASLIAEARKALGGDDKLRAVKSLDVKGDFKRSMGPNTVEGELELRMERPDKLRRDEDLSLPGSGPSVTRTEVLNGTTVWDDNSGPAGFGGGGFGGGRLGDRGFGGGFGRGRVDGGGGGGDATAPADPATTPQARAVDPAQRQELQRRTRQADLARLTLMWLLDTDAPVSWVGTAESPDGKADVLEVATADGPARVFLDESSHMPLMLTWQAGGPGRRGRAGDQAPAQPPTFRMTFDDYKTVNGIKLPHHITRGVNEQTLEEWTVKSYKLNPTFKPDVFTK